ncbi:helix-turn-helix domain-containing protein [Taklimakanibacter lacteus]|uniref:helix-turn-helix domain-containing protein n=1 Tax=Taklimakanibacter lacteus TaxID=2268456 RepID=UPI000E67483C
MSMPQPIVLPTDFKPAAGALLAAAGPVEPSSSPDMAPGPTFHPAMRKTRADYFQCRKTRSRLNLGRTLYRRGESYSAIARALGITPDTARRWVDTEYDAKRRCAAQLNRQPPAEVMDEADLPTLPFVPGLMITGRYCMKPPGR